MVPCEIKFETAKMYHLREQDGDEIDLQPQHGKGGKAIGFPQRNSWQRPAFRAGGGAPMPTTGMTATCAKLHS